MTKKIAFIINPFSGKKKHHNIEQLVRHHLNSQQLKTEFHYTRKRFHGTELALQLSKENDLIIAVGGDGTVNEIAKALINTEVPLGIIPAGSGNGIARNFGIPADIIKAIKLINNYSVRRVDTGLLNGEPFLAVGGCGFDAHIAHLFAKGPKRGFQSYVKLVIKEFKTFKPINITVTIDNKQFESNVFLASVANGKQFGNNAFIAPKAQIDDGFLNLTILKPFKLRSVPFLIMRLFSKTLHTSSLVENYIGKEIKINQEVTYSHVDGEPVIRGTKLEFRVNPLSLNIISRK